MATTTPMVVFGYDPKKNIPPLCTAESITSPTSNTQGKIVNVPDEFDIGDIPDVMRNKLNWPVSAKMMEHWFDLPGREMDEFKEKRNKQLPDARYVSTDLVTYAWLMGFDRVKMAVRTLIAERVYSSAAEKSLRKQLLKAFNQVPHSFADGMTWAYLNKTTDLQELHRNWQFQYVDIGYEIGVMDDLYGAIGNGGIYAALHSATFKLDVVNRPKSATITQVSVYLADTYDFIGEQYLGHWNFDGMGIQPVAGLASKLKWDWKLPGWNPSLGRAWPVSNALFQKYRSMYHMGGDYVVFSKPVVLQLPQPLLINLE
jgi:hypothetical protein